MRIQPSQNNRKNGTFGMADLISPDSVESLRSILINLIAGQTARISNSDFRRLSGDDINAFCSEGRLMMGNLAAAANCMIDTTSGTAVFTKNPARPTAGVWSSLAGGVPKQDAAKRSA
jgi:hypothetical protein